MSNAPQPGTILYDKYQVERVLGVGGMGAVVAAHHLQLDQKVAIKYLLPEALANPEVVERFAREAKAAARIRSEHVARVIDVGKFEDGAPFMVMEYLEGHDLEHELEKNGPLQIQAAMRYMLETCEALAEAHAARIVHRDLKPSNLFLASSADRRSMVKVLDFGISKVDGNAAPSALTKTAAFMGTAFYMSPEQMVSTKDVDARSDIWALGVILYELLTGRKPFNGDSVPEIVAHILQNRPASVRSLRPEIPPELEAVVVRCMQSKQEDRPKNVAVLAALLGPFASPSDRNSIETIARVLGTTPDEAGASVGPLPPSARTNGGGPIDSRTPVPTVDVPAGAASAATNQGVATSIGTATAPKKMSPIAIGAIVAVCAVGAFVGSRALNRGEATATVVAPTTPAADTKANAPSPVAPAVAPPEKIAPLGDVPPANPAPVASAAPAIDTPAAPTKPAKPGDKATPAKPSAKPGAPIATPGPASAAPPAAPPAPAASAAPPPPAPAAPAPPKNPLQMGIK